MIRFPRLAALALLSIATAAYTVPPRRAAPAAAARDWTQTVVATPEGGERMGNPRARVQLVEMLSLTCPHCAHFEETAVPPLLAKYVKRGLVSYEVRIALRDPIDVAAAVAARCDGPRRFFQLVPVLYRTQQDWATKGGAWLNTNPDIDRLSEAEIGKLALQKSGLDGVLARNGMAPGHAAKCMENLPEQRMLAAKAKEMWAMPGFEGTPGFLIDGQLRTDIQDWVSLDAALGPLLH